jgi:DNA ligase-1
MRRFGRRLDVERMRRELPLTTSYFDVLYRDGVDLTGSPQEERSAALGEVVGPTERLVSGDLEQADAFLNSSLAAGHEGIVAKSLDARYEAGRRGGAWLKIKLANTLDLVVLAAEWGHGRRHGYLSNLHFGARDPNAGGFVMLGKTFKGMTDELLAWQTEQLLARAIGRDDQTVYVRPELVVEIAFNEIQTSPQYPGGLALRFARVKGYRSDKRAEDADTIETVREIHARAR